MTDWVRWVPHLTIGGSLIATGDTSATLVGIDALTLVWGRATVLEHPTPATLTVRLLDRGYRYPFAARTDLVGQPVTCEAWDANTGTLRASQFRGRIVDADAAPVVDGHGQIVGMAVTLECVSKEVEVANYRVPAGVTFPAETFSARLARIVSYLPAGFFAGGVALPTLKQMGITGAGYTEFGSWPAGPAASAGGTDVLTLLRQLWDSCYPTPLIYIPDSDKLAAPEAPHTYTANLWQLATGRLRNDVSNVRAGRYVATPGPDGHVWFDAKQISYDGALTQAADSRLTRVEYQYLDSTASYAAATMVAAVPGAPSEATLGRRTLSVDSIAADKNASAAWAASWWAALAGDIAARRRLDPLEFSTAYTQGFETTSHALTLLLGYETTSMLFLAGSWQTALGSRPVLGIIGATVTYAGGEWSITFTPTAISVPANSGTEKPLTIRYASKPGTVARLRDIDPSVTFGDLRYITTGPGYDGTSQLPLGTG